jgi:hypothetical protein
LPVALIAICAMATLAATTISNTLWETVLQQRIPQGSLSRVSSYDWMVSLVFQPISFAIIGPLAATIGEVSTLLLSAAIGLVAQLGALAVPSIRNMRRLELDPNAGPPVDPPLQPPSEAAPIASA